MRVMGLAVFLSTFAVLDHVCASDPDIDSQIQPLVARWDRPDSPGLTLAILKDGQLVFEGAWGSASLELGVPLTPESRLNAASVAKQITATAILMLETKGKLSLDDDVRGYFPELPRYEDTITLRHLLWHTSGLKDIWSLVDLAGWLPTDVRTNEQALRLLGLQQSLNFPPGRAFGYSNSGYLLAAAVVEQVTGQSFADWTRKRLLQPAGLHSTHFLDDHLEIVAGYASAYRSLGREKGFVKDNLTSGAVGSGNLITTAGDLARWAKHLLTSRLGGRPLFEVLGEQGVLVDGQQTGYGFGLFVDSYRGLRTLHHGGNSAGYTAHLLVVQEASFAVAILANVNTVNSRVLAEKITDVYLGERLSGAPTATPAPLKAVEAEPYVGLYELGRQRLLDVRRVDGQLYFFLDGGVPRLMFPGGNHRFTTQEKGLTLTFAVGPNDAMESVMMTVGSRTFDGQRLVPPTLTKKQLRSYEGRYYSEELETFYTIVATDNGLAVRRLRGIDLALVPVDEDRFMEHPAGGLVVRFGRNSFGNVRRFALSVDRARGISFRKQ